MALCHEQVSHLHFNHMSDPHLSSVLADTLLLYRCYAIWDYNIRVVLGPVILLVAGTGSYPFSEP